MTAGVKKKQPESEEFTHSAMKVLRRFGDDRKSRGAVDEISSRILVMNTETSKSFVAGQRQTWFGEEEEDSSFYDEFDGRLCEGFYSHSEAVVSVHRKIASRKGASVRRRRRGDDVS